MTNRLEKIISSMKRERYVSLAFLEQVKNSQGYQDTRIPIGFGQNATKPSIVHKMVHILVDNLTDNTSVIEIGTGSGYQTAILAQIFQKVYTIEFFKLLSEEAQRRLQEFSNIEFLVGDALNLIPELPAVNGLISGACLSEIPSDFNVDYMVIPIGTSKEQHIFGISQDEIINFGPCGFTLMQKDHETSHISR